MVEQIEVGLKEHHRSNTGLSISSLFENLEEGFSIVAIGTIYTLSFAPPSPNKPVF